MNRKKRKISQSFNSWLLLLVVIALLATVAFLWIFQTQMSINNSDKLLRLNIRDVQQDVLDAADDQLLTMTDLVIQEIDAYEYDTDIPLQTFAWKYGLSEINIVDENGIITASSNPAFVGFDMGSGAQAAEFLCLLKGETQFVQKYQPISYNEALSRKYGGIALEDGGFIQVGYDAVSFQRAINHQITRAAKNRHVGEDGGLIIIDEDWDIISDKEGNAGKNLADMGIVLSSADTARGEYFQADVYGEPCYCMYEKAEGYYILAYMPQREVVLSRNVSVSITTAMEIIVFVALFILIYILVRRLIVKNLQKINCSLTKITEGDLEETVEVRSYEEFADLSDDINSTVGTLKKYIADAEARIDAELVLAKTIQLSALPSVFPPFPDRKEFDISAAMVTAKEVGGDFYDFYFLGHELLGFLAADVSGKGIPAAMFMMTSKTVIKANAERRAEVHEVFTQANEKLCEGNEAGMFVTAWMGILNTRTGLVTFANAGHNPPLVRKGGGDFEYLRVRPGFVLAGMEGVRYKKNEIQLEPGDVIFLYTDGVTEATNANNELYGEDRLLAVLNANKDADTDSICKAVQADVDLFVGEAPQFDDITMVCLRYNGEGA